MYNCLLFNATMPCVKNDGMLVAGLAAFAKRNEG